jgi:predicted  nucleic acid-binding Zn-ribbon protein
MVIPVFSQQEKPVVISFGQPNIWSLEQAHYLLARMNRQNLDLQTAALGDLDPNAANASRIDILKTLIEAGVKFDDAARVNNQLLRSDKTFNSQRRQDLLSRRSSLQAESTQLARELAELKISKAEATTDEDRARIQAEIEAKTEQKAAVDNEVTQTNGELQGLTSASGNFTSTEPSDTSGSFSSDKLKGDLDEIIKRVPLISPTIAATLRLDNHIQMQYEIIAKQLTLLRDEVGPGERLVFLELPQSVNATQDKAENKMAQVWWRIAGFTRVDKEALFQNELNDIKKKIASIRIDLDKNDNLTITFTQNWLNLRTQLDQLCREEFYREQVIEEANKLKDAKKKQELCEKVVHDLEQIRKAIDDTKEAIRSVDDQKIKLQKERARLSQAFTALSTKYEKLRLEQVRRKVREQQDAADKLLQGGGTKTSEIVSKTISLMSRQGNSLDFKSAEYGNSQGEKGKEYSATEDGREYVNLDLFAAASEDDKQRLRAGRAMDNANDFSLLRNRSVRTIDIIPRQNALNVNDTKQRVSKTGIFAAFSFLFGFGGKFGYERQREQSEQFLNQELFTSGFGKGETDFGWNFYPFAGTKQLAPGVRTTYAIAIIPDDAESIVLKARGCYFPRKENQPLNYDMAGATEWTARNPKVGSCTPQEQVFVLPVPGGSGDGADFYVTEVRYSAHRKPGERMVASIYGQNLPTQIGVLVNGVPLTQSVGLAQLSVESILGDKVKENCVGQICGRFERIDPNQIVISFNMPPDFVGSPRVGLVGPGKAIELNRLYLNINGTDDTQLEGAEWMFGKPPTEASRSIADFKVAPAPDPQNGMNGVLSGGKFKDTDTIYVNGHEAKRAGIACQRPDLCIVSFPVQGTDFLTVTVSPQDKDEEAVSRTFVNPTYLSIISSSVVSSDKGDDKHPPVVTVKLDGSGFKNTLNVDFDGTGTLQKKTVPSSGQMILDIVSPKSVVQIILKDPDNNKTVSTVVVSPVR